MPKNKYFISQSEFTEPFGQVIPKESIFMFKKVHDFNHNWFFYYDKEEDGVYPIIVPKEVIKQIGSEQIDKRIIKMFEVTKNR